MSRFVPLVVGAVVVLMLAFTSVALAEAGKPWWHLTAEPVPTYLNSSAERSEVQRLAVNATGGDVLWIEPVSLAEFEAGKIALSEIKRAVFAFDASAGEVQQALQASDVYGAGNVEVSGGPVGKPAVVTELEPYVIRFVGALANRLVPPPPSFFTHAEIFGGVNLEGETSVSETTPGHAAGEIVVTATNLGDAPAEGETEPITLSDVLPAGFEAVGVSGEAFEGDLVLYSALQCSLGGENGVVGPACSFAGKVYPYAALTLHLQVDAPGAKAGEEARASVSGGGVRPVSVSRKIPLGVSTPFGVSDYELVNENEGGGVDTQAGSHPFQQTTTVVLNQAVDPANGFIEPAQPAEGPALHVARGAARQPDVVAAVPAHGFPERRPVSGGHGGRCRQAPGHVQYGWY